MLAFMETPLSMSVLRQPTILDSPCSKTPAELWLHILEIATINSAEHTWTTVRTVSHHFESYVERVFTSMILPAFAISLSLPRRDSISGALKWTALIPTASIIMNFHHLDHTQQFAYFSSPSVLNGASESKTLEELKNSGALPRERLLESPAWVFCKPNFMSGRYMEVSKHLEFDWSEEHKAWMWKIEWRKLLSHFYKAKRKARIELEDRKCKAQARRSRFSALSLEPGDPRARRRRPC